MCVSLAQPEIMLLPCSCSIMTTRPACVNAASRFSVLAVQMFIRGGNYIVADAMMRATDARLQHEVRPCAGITHTSLQQNVTSAIHRLQRPLPARLCQCQCHSWADLYR